MTHRSIGRGSALIRRAGLAPIARVGLVLGLAAGLALPWFTPAGLAQTTWRYYFPMILGPGLPAGTYDCEEYEAGLIWTTDVITLFPDGESLYAYQPPYGGVVTGTWVFTRETNEIAFTSFRWETATVEFPGRIWSRRTLVDPAIEIALECRLR